MSSIFDLIINRKAKAKLFYEDDDVIVIRDHRPQAMVHLLIICKEPHVNFFEAPAKTIAMMNKTAKLIAKKLGIGDHFRLITNNGWCQEVPHFHYHFLSNQGSEKLEFTEIGG